MNCHPTTGRRRSTDRRGRGSIDRIGEWYLHLFDSKQPDLNWDNPDVRAEFTDILRFWFDAGADGFRIDVAHALLKADGLPDLGEEFPPTARRPASARPSALGSIRRTRHLPPVARGGRLVRPATGVRRRGLGVVGRQARRVPATWSVAHRVRLPHHTMSVGSRQLHDAISTSLAAHQADRGAGHVGVEQPRHQPPRHPIREGTDAHPLHGRPDDPVDLPLGTRRARAAILLELALPGAVYLYQGEELGLPEVDDIPEDMLADPTWERSGHTRRGRDGCRVPLPWTRSGPSFGFGSTAPWLPQPRRLGRRCRSRPRKRTAGRCCGCIATRCAPDANSPNCTAMSSAGSISATK